MFSRRRQRALEQQRRKYASAAAQHLVAADCTSRRTAVALEPRGTTPGGRVSPMVAEGTVAPAMQIAALKECVRARDDTIACLSCEVQLLRTAISVLKEDLSVKDEQFDTLFRRRRSSMLITL